MRWAARRSFEAVVLVLLGTAILVALVHLIPGDPLAAIIGDRALSPAAREALSRRWGVDRTVPMAIVDFFRNAFGGDLGTSIARQRPVTEVLASHLGPTLLLGGLTLIIDFSIGLALGLWSALHPETLRARILGTITLVTYTIPAFVIGLVLVWICAVELRWFPPAGWADPLLSQDASIATVLADRLKHLVLPLTTMVLATIAVPLRHQRSAALESADSAWVTAARARGVAPTRIAWRHVWRPALTPIITLLGLWLPLLVSGAVFVEAVFAWPGIGSLLAGATAERDIPIVVAAGALLVLMVQLGSLVADLLYHLVDPVQRDR